MRGPHDEAAAGSNTKWPVAAATKASAAAVALAAPGGSFAADALPVLRHVTPTKSRSEPNFQVPAPDSPDLAWWRDSMKTHDQRMGWWRAARFGLFIHWGVYSDLAGVWQGQPIEGYAEHIQRKAKIPMETYRREVAARFNPTKFDADQWAQLAKEAGMGYLVITSKHHDGFAMYDSDVSSYNIVKASAWKRDPMRELKRATERVGIKLGFYYSQAWDWGEPDGAGNDW